MTLSWHPDADRTAYADYLLDLIALAVAAATVAAVVRIAQLT